MNRRSILKWLGLALPATGAFAQAPSRTGRLVVPLGPGSPSDLVARLIAPGLGAGLNQTCVVDNKPGGNGIIAVQDVMRSAPDGTTLMLSSVSPLAINMAVVKNLPYDTRRDLTAIGGIYTAHHVLIVKSTSPIRTLPEFIAYAKQRPGKVAVGYSATLVQAQILALNKLAGIELLPVPYKSTSATYTDMMGDTLQAAFYDLGNVQAQVKGNQVRVLGISLAKRNPMEPDWPAIAETVPGFDFSSWSALLGPPGMSRELVDRVNTALVATVKPKDTVDKFAAAGLLPWTTTPDELKSYIETQVARWQKLVKDYGIQAE